MMILSGRRPISPRPAAAKSRSHMAARSPDDGKPAHLHRPDAFARLRHRKPVRHAAPRDGRTVSMYSQAGDRIPPKSSSWGVSGFVTGQRECRARLARPNPFPGESIGQAGRSGAGSGRWCIFAARDQPAAQPLTSPSGSLEARRQARFDRRSVSPLKFGRSTSRPGRERHHLAVGTAVHLANRIVRRLGRRDTAPTQRCPLPNDLDTGRAGRCDIGCRLLIECRPAVLAIGRPTSGGVNAALTA